MFYTFIHFNASLLEMGSLCQKIEKHKINTQQLSKQYTVHLQKKQNKERL